VPLVCSSRDTTFKSEKEIFVSQLRLFLVAALAVAALAVPGAVDAGGTVTQPLIAAVGSKASPDDFVISLTDSTGAKVTHLDTGAYTITVHDYATLHSFHLLGPGVDQATGVETTGDTTWNVVVIDGTYRYFCDAHPTTMRGSFTAGIVTTPPPPKKLVAQVGPKQTISLKTASGARVKQLKAGRYSIKVKDLTKADNFHLVAPGANRRTAVKSRGAVTWNVTLRAGSGTYRSDAHRRLHGSFRVT
jgi:plastocyanin